MSAGAQAPGAVVRQGHLRKLKTMKKKYFVLRAETSENSARLEYYESEKKFKSGSAPRRVLPLKSCYNITRRLDLKQKHVIALFTRDEQFCVVAENEPDLHGWLTSILKQHRNDDASDELLHPIQHVWQVTVQKKGLGATKNIQGLYNLCLTDKTLTLVKIKSQNNVISDLGIPERVEYALKNIRRCGDSECFFYMEVGRQTATGAGELWMHSEDANIAQSMHSTIYHAMRNCAKETENERDHISLPRCPDGSNPLPARRQTIDGSRRGTLSNERGLCVRSCIKQCVCASAYSVDDSAALVPLTASNAENQPPNNTLTDKEAPRAKHHRTVSLPTGCPLFQEPLKIVHERTRSAPLTGDEVDRVILEKSVTHSSCKAVNGTDFAKKSQWPRRASTGTRLSKLSPAHTKNAPAPRGRCDSMPARACASLEVERPARRADTDGMEVSRDEADSAEWHRTPRIPEEPDFCDPAARDLTGTSYRGSIQHSRTSSIGIDDAAEPGDGYHRMSAMGDSYLRMGDSCLGLAGDGYLPVGTPDGYLPMAPRQDPLGGLAAASSGSVCSGTPSTDPRFSEYQLEPATSHIIESERPPRAYSVGSRPAGAAAAARAEPPRHRAYSVGARHRPPPPPPPRHPAAGGSAPLLPRASAEDLMELDFSNTKVVVARTPPAPGFMDSRPKPVDEYVDMSPRNAGYVEMRPGDGLLSRSPPAPAPAPPTPDGYVEMNYGKSRPIAIAAATARQPPLASSPDDRKRHTTQNQAERPQHSKENRTPLGSQTIFPLSLDSPASPPELDSTEIFEEDPSHHPLTTVREISEECGRKSPEIASSPSYVKLALPGSKPIAAPPKTPDETVELSCNPLANKTLARLDSTDARGESTATVVVAGGGPAARFSVAAAAAAAAAAGPLNYAALDLQPRQAAAAPAPRAYTQIDFARSEQLHAEN